MSNMGASHGYRRFDGSLHLTALAGLILPENRTPHGGPRMATRTSINDKADGIGAPKIGLSHLFHYEMAVNLSSSDWINMPAAVRGKKTASETDPSYTFQVGRT
jgi:hypothetical protein